MAIDKEQLSLEADRLKKDPVFLEVIQRIRASAVESLINTPATDTHKVVSLQCVARICDLFPQELEAMIRSKNEHKPFQAI